MQKYYVLNKWKFKVAVETITRFSSKQFGSYRRIPKESDGEDNYQMMIDE